MGYFLISDTSQGVDTGNGVLRLRGTEACEQRYFDQSEPEHMVIIPGQHPAGAFQRGGFISGEVEQRTHTNPVTVGDGGQV